MTPISPKEESQGRAWIRLRCPDAPEGGLLGAPAHHGHRKEGHTQDSAARTEESVFITRDRRGHNHILPTRVSLTRSLVVGPGDPQGRPSHPPCQPGSRCPLASRAGSPRVNTPQAPLYSWVHSPRGRRPPTQIGSRRHLGSDRAVPQPGPLTPPGGAERPAPRPRRPLGGDRGAASRDRE